MADIIEEEHNDAIVIEEEVDVEGVQEQEQDQDQVLDEDEQLMGGTEANGHVSADIADESGSAG